MTTEALDRFSLRHEHYPARGFDAAGFVNAGSFCAPIPLLAVIEAANRFAAADDEIWGAFRERYPL